MWLDVLWAVLLMAAALGVLLAELLMVSFGLFSAAALGLAVASIIMGFKVHDGLGWGLLLAAPILAIPLLRWGLRRLRGNAVVAKAEITATAGIEAQARMVGASLGAVGRLMTDAMPTGRARFPAGDVDVTVSGTLGARGDQVEVILIDGPSVTVAVVTPANGSSNAVTP